MEKKELLKKVKEDGWALDDAENKFKKDKDIVLAAVTQNGTALEYADKLLKKDKKINEVKKSTDIKSQGKDTYFQIFKVSIIFLHPNFLRLSQVYSQEH